ncbi:unnamed protein product [Umbelopsis vinacea]
MTTPTSSEYDEQEEIAETDTIAIINHHGIELNIVGIEGRLTTHIGEGTVQANERALYFLYAQLESEKDRRLKAAQEDQLDDE